MKSFENVYILVTLNSFCHKSFILYLVTNDGVWLITSCMLRMTSSNNLLQHLSTINPFRSALLFVGFSILWIWCLFTIKFCIKNWTFLHTTSPLNHYIQSIKCVCKRFTSLYDCTSIFRSIWMTFPRILRILTEYFVGFVVQHTPLSSSFPRGDPFLP